MSINYETPMDLRNSKNSDYDEALRGGYEKNSEFKNRLDRTDSVYSNSKASERDSGCGSSVQSIHSNSDEEIDNNCVKSNSDNNANLDNDEKKRDPKCARCRNHNKTVQVKGHKRKCEYKDCECELCRLTDDRRRLMAKTISAKRRQTEDMADGTYIPPTPVIKQRKIEDCEITIQSKTILKVTDDDIPNKAVDLVLDVLLKEFGLSFTKKTMEEIRKEKINNSSYNEDVFMLINKKISKYDIQDRNCSRSVSIPNPKHSAFNKFNNHKTTPLTQSEMTPRAHLFNSPKLGQAFNPNVSLVQSQHLPPVYMENNTQLYSTNSTFNPYLRQFGSIEAYGLVPYSSHALSTVLTDQRPFYSDSNSDKIKLNMNSHKSVVNNLSRNSNELTVSPNDPKKVKSVFMDRLNSGLIPVE